MLISYASVRFCKNGVISVALNAFPPRPMSTYMQHLAPCVPLVLVMHNSYYVKRDYARNSFTLLPVLVLDGYCSIRLSLERCCRCCTHACPVHDGTATDFAATDAIGSTTQLRPYSYMTSQLDTTYSVCILATRPDR